jgi:hypothetical protein
MKVLHRLAEAAGIVDWVKRDRIRAAVRDDNSASVGGEPDLRRVRGLRKRGARDAHESPVPDAKTSKGRRLGVQDIDQATMLGHTPRRPAAARNGLKQRECVLTGRKNAEVTAPGARHEQVMTIPGEDDGPLRLSVGRSGSRAAGGKCATLDQRSVRIAAKCEHPVALGLVALDVDIVGQSCTPSVRRRVLTLLTLASVELRM